MACAVVAAAAGCAVSLAAAAPASGAETYRIVAGEISFSGNATRKCPSASTGSCGDLGNAATRTSLDVNHSTAASFSVDSPGAPADSGAEEDVEVAFAPLTIDNWNHTYESKETYTTSYCESAETTRYSHSDLRHDGGTSPSLYEMGVRVSRGSGSTGLDISLAQPPDVFNIGIRYPAYETASSVLGTWETKSPCPDRSSTSSSRENLLTYCVFDFYPCTPRTTPGISTSDPPVCDEAGRCVVRARGSTSWSYGPEYGGDDVSGSMAISWWVDVEIAPSCVVGFVAKDWLGYDAGDRSSPHRADSSYGLAIKWCTKPNELTTLKSADVRVDENRANGGFDAFGKAVESITFDVNTRWVPDRSPKVKKKALPGGGLRVTAATGHFDVCVGIGGPFYGLSKRAFKLLPARARRAVARRFENSASRWIDGMWDEDYERIRKQLIGKKNPRTGRPYTREARRKEAARRAHAVRDARYWLLEQELMPMIERADFKACFRAWEPKIIATIAVDGSLAWIRESGFARTGLWLVREDKGSGACGGSGCP